MSQSEVLFSQTQMVPVGTLKPYDKNPRKGNVRAIAESLETNKQYRPIVVQASTKKILAGNHTWQAAKSLGWEKIAVVFVDVDDEQAKRIVLADNRTNDLAAYDDRILAELLKDLGDATGTGYSERDMEAILSAASESASEVVRTADELGERTVLDLDSFSSGPVGRDDDDVSIVGFGDDEEQSIEDTSEQLPGVIQLDDERFFEGCGPWDFPPLRPDMLITDLPEGLRTWAGSATRDIDHDGYWLYNWAIDSTSGMKDLSKVMVAFYTHDEYFDPWWDYAARYTTKLLNTRVKYAIMPNYSSGSLPKALSIFQMYKSFWVARFLQEAGIKVMPDMEVAEGPEFIKAWQRCLPKRVPWLATQIQNVNATSRTGKQSEEKDWVRLMEIIGEQCEGMEVENILVYAPSKRWGLIEKHWPLPSTTPHFFKTRVELLSEHGKARTAATKERGF